ncbi:MAG: spore maturation protein [Clostridia bacterium]|nr:spore maturation protein [Clostridia bacterium]
MVNYLWLFLLSMGIVTALSKGEPGLILQSALAGAEQAVQISLGLIAIMSFWLGIMRLAEAAGLVRLLSKLMAPLTRRLFPEIPPEHPALGAIGLNLTANILGLGNAATPMGLLAMQEMQKLNQSDPKTATPSMCTFLALNTACPTLIPSTIIGIRIMFHSTDPTSIVGATIAATGLGMLSAIMVDRILQRIWKKAPEKIL